MAIYLGNLTIEQMEKRMGIQFPDDVREFMKKSHQSKAENIAKGKWHCFDIPFTLVCGDRETAIKIYNGLKDQQEDIKEPLQISLNK